MNKLSLFKLLSVMIIPVVMSFIFGSASYAAEATCPKPMVLEFSSPMCSACKQLEQVLPGVEAKYAGKVDVKKINTASPDAEGAQLMKMYGINAVPTLVFINKDGIMVKTTQGCLPQAQLDAYFNELITK